jgi:predicted metal-dependent hydrolase
MRGLLQLALDFLDAPFAEPRPSPSTDRVPTSANEPGAAFSSSHAYTHPRANRQTRLDEVPVAYEFKRGRRRTIGMSVGEAGLTVSAPRWTPLHEVEAVLQEKAAWIVRKLHEMQARRLRAQAARLEWGAGTVLPWLGLPLTLALAEPVEPTAPVWHAAQTVLPPTPSSGPARSRRPRRMAQPVLDTGDTRLSGEVGRILHLDLPVDALPEQIRDAVQAWFLHEARGLFAQRLEHYAPLLQVQWRKLALSNARTRWGSASSDGRIHLNWRLMHMPLEVIDYVVVHELSHLRVMDHSPRFWATVRSVMPDYERRRAALRDITLPVWSE